MAAPPHGARNSVRRRSSPWCWAGRRQQAGTWGPTSDNNARVIGASAILLDALARVEVTDPAGEVLAVFEPGVG